MFNKNTRDNPVTCYLVIIHILEKSFRQTKGPDHIPPHQKKQCTDILTINDFYHHKFQDWRRFLRK